MNSVILSGWLTRDPEIRISEKDGKQLKMSLYTLAVRRPIAGADQADYISCAALEVRRILLKNICLREEK